IQLRGSVVQKTPWAKLGHKDPAMAVAADVLRGGLWLGFYDGGVAYFRDGHIRESYSAADGLGAGRGNGLRLDGDGALWASTEGGLRRLRDGRVATLNSKRRTALRCGPWGNRRRRPLAVALHGLWLGAYYAG